MSDATMKLTQPTTISSDDGAPLISGTVKHTPDGGVVGIWLDETGYDVPIEVWRAFVVALDPEHAPTAALLARIAELEAEADERREKFARSEGERGAAEAKLIRAMGALRDLSGAASGWNVAEMTEAIRAKKAGRSGFQAKLAINALAELSGMDPDESSVSAMTEHAQAKLDSVTAACDDAMMHLHELALGELSADATYRAGKIADVIRAKHVRELASIQGNLKVAYAGNKRLRSVVAGECGAAGVLIDELYGKLDTARAERKTVADELRRVSQALTDSNRERATEKHTHERATAELAHVVADRDELQRRLDVIAVAVNGDDRDPRVSP